MSSLVKSNRPTSAGRQIGDRALGEAQIDDLDLVTALLVKANGRTNQRRDAIKLLLRALRIDQLTRIVGLVDTIDQNGDGQPLDRPRLLNGRALEWEIS